jgi:hypothetical protein
MFSAFLIKTGQQILVEFQMGRYLCGGVYLFFVQPFATDLF